MKKPFFTLFATALFMLFLVSANAQSYKSAVGLRLGYPWSVTYKTFLNDNGALEVYAGYRGWEFYNWFSLNAAYQYHKPFPSVENLSWYVGGGAGVYFWSYDNAFLEADESTSFSLQGYLGLDYKFENAPFNISVDWVPTFFLTGYGSGFGAGYGNLAVRYVIN